MCDSILCLDNRWQYFLTLDADGVKVSSDFYLTLVHDGNKMLKGEIPLQE